ncbi:hypothetical protein A3K34_03635 [candidate division WWE3 bacterium RIFOXYC1_FULL_40_10]|nr:MAG: hypothetical protein A3K58_03635 [candidate division WWE3 bacterium RIFOXYB1_FULL_40_22]OGC61935.1 MAG: hypothetical protein A3K37_03635 [candidate division WWE3 bacterium RIFOXYA1_FULL_40_11]OGC64492.1 MAG: hypothetical protein A2326_03775 [candidate division WWE3 bacterium RIFOXYB2_FULL_41_6]OGC66318.1 MAG: hypothetical protein A3K34_03635 [candidate division WWE3 bacterium RIFOXYC1_FULL_40_10]OGC67920.1 MAG: hypothetical protein A2450_01830 [candidate division WWE3 bacterium RIFOXYC2
MKNGNRLSKLLSNKRIRIGLICLYAFLVLVSVYHVVYAKRIIPGVRIGSVKVGGKNFTEAKALVEKRIAESQTDLILDEGNIKYLIAGKDIHLQYDVDNSISRAFEVGRTGNIIYDSKDKLAGFLKPLYINLFFDYNEDVLSRNYSLIKGDVNKQAVDAGVAFENNTIVVTKSNEGKKVVNDELHSIVMNSFGGLDFEQKQVPLSKVTPRVVEKDVEQILSQIKRIVMNKLSVKYNDYVKSLSTVDLIEFLDITNRDKLEIGINEPRLELFVQSVAMDVNNPPRARVTRVDREKVLDFELVSKGLEVNTKAFSEQFKEAYLGGLSQVEIPVTVISGPTDKSKYGIYSLLGEGSSTYYGSMSSRIHNLTLAAERTNGVLVPPGEIYSMNNSIGEISAATGYNSAYIISRGRTILGEGGGVCQTSTTLFRAALDAGLPIVTRYPHDYRVSYYEQDRAPGFDATIFQPSIDFQFKNDTPNYILVQTDYNKAEQWLKFSIYGTPDGREVETSESVLTNQSPPPASLYQDDPTLPKGTVKQVDWSAWGGTATFSRTVKRGEEIIGQDTFVSNYRPWRAIFLVGTKDN